MNYTMRRWSDDEPVATLAAHVLARAYGAAWRARHGNDPAGPHIMAGLDLVIEFIEADGNQDAAF
jgi:hypothetical protein